MRSPGLQRVPTTPWLDSERQGPVVPWAIQSASVRHPLVSSPLQCWQARQAHIRLSYVRAWKFPFRLGRMWRTCVQLPRMHALPVPLGPASNAVAIPTGAPTCPPWVALSAVSAQLSGAQEPGVFGSQPEAPGPHASTMPPPVTRQPLAGIVVVVVGGAVVVVVAGQLKSLFLGGTTSCEQNLLRHMLRVARLQAGAVRPVMLLVIVTEPPGAISEIG